MTDEKKPTDPKPVADDKVAPAHKITRRRFTKAGAVAPVIMTLGSRPVWGATSNSSAVGSDAGSLDMTASAIQKVASTAGEWLSAARIAAWPTSRDYPLFTATSADSFGEHFRLSQKLSFQCTKANDDVEKLMKKSLSDVLSGRSVKNSRLSLLATEATAARLNALLSDAVERKISAAQDLFPWSPNMVVDAFWTAVLNDCASVGTVPTTTLTVASSDNTSQPTPSDTSCSSYDSGLAMNLQAYEFGDLNRDGTSLL